MNLTNKDVLIVTSFAGKHWQFAQKLVLSLEANANAFDKLIYCDAPVPSDLNDMQCSKLKVVDTQKFRHRAQKIALLEEEKKISWAPEHLMIPNGKTFLWEAARFFNKILALDDALKDHIASYKRVVWLDSDVELIKPINDLLQYIRLDQNHVFWGLERPQLYTETGFMAFNPENQYFDEFWAIVEDLYEAAGIFQLSAWTDCHALDYARDQMVVKYGRDKIFKNINDTWYDFNTDPANNSSVGNYLAHQKGLGKFHRNDDRSIKKQLKQILKRVWTKT